MAPHLDLMLITNQPELGRTALTAGVDRLFIDLERLGKLERQGHLDTHISDHRWEDIADMRQTLPDAKLLVRINPMNVNSPHEIEMALHAHTDILMLPMFRTRAEVAHFLELVDGRAMCSLLLETPQALVRAPDIMAEKGIDEVHIGLNDLHLGLGLKFMFEILSSGLLDFLSDIVHSRGIRFGFGGVARIGEGLLPAEVILREHARLNSEGVILSRTFHRRARSVEEMQRNVDLAVEIERIREVYQSALVRSKDEVERDRQDMVRLVHEIIRTSQG